MTYENTDSELNGILERRKLFLEKWIEEKKKALKSAPDGSLRCTSTSGYRIYYHITTGGNSNGTYIRRKDEGLVRALAQKDYDRAVLKTAQSELARVNSFLHFRNQGTVEAIYPCLSENRKKLVDPMVLSDHDFVEYWQKMPYERKGFREDAPDFYTQKGERVRSKSEILIADVLNRNGVPYRYEYPLDLPGAGVIHPDFTVLCADRQEMIWEHLGMMDDPEYAAGALRRIDLYERSGYYPGRTIILTHETAARPLGTRMIEAVIREYLL